MEECAKDKLPSMVMILSRSYSIDADNADALLNLIFSEKVAQFKVLKEVIDNFDLQLLGSSINNNYHVHPKPLNYNTEPTHLD